MFYPPLKRILIRNIAYDVYLIADESKVTM